MRSRQYFSVFCKSGNEDQNNIRVSAWTVRHNSVQIIFCLTWYNGRHKWRLIRQASQINTLSVALLEFCWWRHNRLRSAWWDPTIVMRHVKSYMFHGVIYGRSCEEILYHTDCWLAAKRSTNQSGLGWHTSFARKCHVESRCAWAPYGVQCS